MVTIINYGMGNIGSIANMIERIGYKSIIASDVSQIESADKIILPGVGNFDKAMYNINQSGLRDVIKKMASENKIPILGICLGMQIMCKKSEEGCEAGLGLIDAEVKRFSFSQKDKLKIPHMGWNTVKAYKNEPLFAAIQKEPRFYFVHSYHVVCHNSADILTTTEYGYEFHSSFSNNNILGVQFHPEKSHKFGMQLLKNFIEYY